MRSHSDKSRLPPIQEKEEGIEVSLLEPTTYICKQVLDDTITADSPETKLGKKSARSKGWALPRAHLESTVTTPIGIRKSIENTVKRHLGRATLLAGRASGGLYNKREQIIKPLNKFIKSQWHALSRVPQKRQARLNNLSEDAVFQRLGEYQFVIDQHTKVVQITHPEQPDQPIFQRVGEDFLKLNRLKIKASAANLFCRTDMRTYGDSEQTIEAIEATDQHITIKGTLTYKSRLSKLHNQVVAYTATFTEKHIQTSNESKSQIEFEIKVSMPDKESLTEKDTFAISLVSDKTDNDHFKYGLGEFNEGLNREGERYESYSKQQSITNRHPIPRVPVAIASRFSAARHDVAQKTIPMYVGTSENGYYTGVMLKQIEPVMFNFNQYFQDTILVGANNGKLEISGTFYHGMPKSIHEEITHDIGRMPIPHAWTQEGAIIALQGGMEKIQDDFDMLMADENSDAITGLFIQDTTGLNPTPVLEAVNHDWVFNNTHYPAHAWNTFVDKAQEKNIRLLSYFNPHIAVKFSKEGEPPTLYEIARDRGYLLTHSPPSEGVTERKDNDVYTDSLGINGKVAFYDITNPEVRTYLKEIIRETIVNKGFSGFMADFGEAIPPNTVYTWDGRVLGHQAYIQEYDNFISEILADLQTGRPNTNDRREPLFVFKRSGVKETAQHISAGWSGDQAATESVHANGLEAAIYSTLNAALIGYQQTHTDIAGYYYIGLPIYQDPIDKHQNIYFNIIQRDIWTNNRWLAFQAFGNLFRTHGGNLPHKNIQAYTNPYTRAITLYWAKVFALLKPYRSQHNLEGQETGLNTIRPMFYEYPKEPIFRSKETELQFMLGPDILVSPITKRYHTEESQDIYLPKGEWYDLWSGKHYCVTDDVMKIKSDAVDFDKIPAFVRADGEQHLDEILVDTIHNIRAFQQASAESLQSLYEEYYSD